MGSKNQDNNGYIDDEGGGDEYRDQVLQLCKLAQGNITTIYWCKQQIRKRLKVLDRLVDRIASIKKLESSKDKWAKKRSIEEIIKKQTDACKNLGLKIQEEIESLEQIRIAAKSFGIDIRTKLLELDNTLEDKDIDTFFDEE
jgi:hypothetical protein